jgi:hypothetical protein
MNNMKNMLFLLLPFALLASCKKPYIPANPASAPVTSHPAMRYTDLHDATVRAHKSCRLDIDGDGSTDFYFFVQRVGDPMLQIDKVQYIAASGISRNLLVNDESESPVLQAGDSITLERTGFNWWEISETLLAEKRIGNTENWWEGLWKSAQHRFLPVQVQQGSTRYNGWVELSMNRNTEELILHRAAISLEARKSVLAGF